MLYIETNYSLKILFFLEQKLVEQSQENYWQFNLFWSKFDARKLSDEEVRFYESEINSWVFKNY